MTVDEVVDKYIELVQDNVNSGLGAFINAGARTLIDPEIREAVYKITQRGLKSPFGKVHTEILGKSDLVDLLNRLKLNKFSVVENLATVLEKS
jgi:hypothetical protein